MARIAMYPTMPPICKAALNKNGTYDTLANAIISGASEYTKTVTDV